MSFHYNEAFENLDYPYSEPLEVDDPDYHYADTLELDRIRTSEGSTSFHYNPYDSSPYNSYGEHHPEGVRRQNSSIHIPMNSVQIQNSVNPSFEYEPEFVQTPPADINVLNHHYTRKHPASSVGGKIASDKLPNDIVE
ncbi:hypothetical protein JD844_019798 [Phrynosoma platyrhinos]|uniref:Uncharacterized protein n=1 Tax=Phrynosoma platyrhinos TaxID=52577 RepID=A0ABQ7TQC8_PHRPL|nr:hypothetical protein JD844_019798 [Phrynosoma platyrhinos]